MFFSNFSLPLNHREVSQCDSLCLMNSRRMESSLLLNISIAASRSVSLCLAAFISNLCAPRFSA